CSNVRKGIVDNGSRVFALDLALGPGHVCLQDATRVGDARVVDERGQEKEGGLGSRLDTVLLQTEQMSKHVAVRRRTGRLAPVSNVGLKARRTFRFWWRV